MIDSAADEFRGHDASGESTSGELTIQQVSRALDVPAPTLRSWERRYGVPVTGRSRGGHRRYSVGQVDMLRRMRDHIADGHRAVEAADRVRSEFGTAPEPLVQAFLQAAHDLQPMAIAEILDMSNEALGLDRTVDEVLFPALRQIGQLWESGVTDEAHEHLATHATHGWLAVLAQTGPDLLPYPPIILACGPRDHHTLGLEAIGAMLRQRGWDCRLLGARTPAAALARAVVETDAAAVVLVSHLSPGRQAAVDALNGIALNAIELRHTQLFYAGGAFSTPRARNGVPGHYLGDNLSRAAELVGTTLLDQA